MHGPAMPIFENKKPRAGATGPRSLCLFVWAFNALEPTSVSMPGADFGRKPLGLRWAHTVPGIVKIETIIRLAGQDVDHIRARIHPLW
jgi:hypothetical protein